MGRTSRPHRPVAIPIAEGGLAWIAAAGGTALAALAIEDRTPRSLAFGALLLIPGVLLALAALRARGDGAALISTGPYRWIRHPYYLAILVMLVGEIVALRAWPALILLVPTARLIREQARREEHNLVLRFEDAYEEYQRRVPAFLPVTPPLPRDGLALGRTPVLGLEEPTEPGRPDPPA